MAVISCIAVFSPQLMTAAFSYPRVIGEGSGTANRIGLSSRFLLRNLCYKGHIYVAAVGNLCSFLWVSARKPLAHCRRCKLSTQYQNKFSCLSNSLVAVKSGSSMPRFRQSLPLLRFPQGLTPLSFSSRSTSLFCNVSAGRLISRY